MSTTSTTARSLKAEHGTGINMAPFVRHEWGDKATDIMWRIKKLADPHGVLAPNVVLTRDDGIHLKSFKSMPPVEDNATHCIECGFCEAACPSATSPRPRGRGSCCAGRWPASPKGHPCSPSCRTNATTTASRPAPRMAPARSRAWPAPTRSR